jgi:hypothetical protein
VPLNFGNNKIPSNITLVLRTFPRIMGNTSVQNWREYQPVSKDTISYFLTKVAKYAALTIEML